MEILRVENLNFKYSESPVLRDVNFSINSGDFLGIIGANGAGKSTLLKLILGLLPISEGDIYVKGESVKKSAPRIGYVSQKANSFNADFPATVSEVVLSGIRKRVFSAYTRADKDKLFKTLKSVGIYEYRDKLIGRLSGGQQQRAFIARALIADNDIIILDEPTVGIDAAAVRGISELICDINRRGITVIMTNHDTPSLAGCANKLLVFCEHGNGELLEKSSLTERELNEIYAGKRGHNHA